MRKPEPSTARAPAAAPRMPAASSRRPRQPLAALETAPNPIDESRFPGDPEGDAKEELSQLDTGFRERMKAEAERYKAATSVDYFFVVVCNSGEQAEALLKGMGAPTDKLYVDGRQIAKTLGIDIPPDPPIERIKVRRSPDLVAMVRKPAPRS